MKKEILNFGKFSSSSLNCTRKFAFNLAESLNPPYVLYLNGILGSGKTFFCKCVGEYYGIKSINSASFTRVEHNFGEINLVHCDFYRGLPEPSFFEEEIEPRLTSPWIILIEWGKLTTWDFNCPEYELDFKYIDPTRRDLLFSNRSV